MTAKIVQIMNNDGSPKEDISKRIGRIFDLNKSFIKIGYSACLYCIHPGPEKSLCTSVVTDVLMTEDKAIIWTYNSIYVLDRERR